MRIEDIGLESVNKSFEVSKETFDYLRYATDKACNEIAKAFEALKREWAKAVDDYNNEIKRLKEGK